MADLETTIRTELGIPDNAESVMILSMDAHMDWDWVATFQEYLFGVDNDSGHVGVTRIIPAAFECMKGTGPAPNTYYYSICEMGYFQNALEVEPRLLDNFQENIGNRLRIVGGGVTSPDNLLPHGEAILRNYLVGKTWMQQTLGLPLQQAYVPDDFGNDSQFPVLLEAMGFQGVSFSRIPGAPDQNGYGGVASPTYGNNQSLNNTLVAQGVDFVWKAADGSTTVAHYMQDSYCQGNGVATGNSNTNIQSYIATNQPSAPTPYIYVPCGCDFALPITNLVEIAANWNSQMWSTNQSDVYVVVATLDHYIQLLSTYIDPSVQHNYGPYKNLSTRTDFKPTPYWTGHYASRIGNKILHQAATRALLGAETFSVVADLFEGPDKHGFRWLTEGRWEAIENGWKGLVPSTHHDYINGTATDEVTTNEQVPLLAGVLGLGDGARASAIDQIATQINTAPSQGETPVAVFNQLGFAVTGPTEIPARPGIAAESISFPDGTSSPVQTTHDGNWLFIGSAPSLGYQTGYLSASTVNLPNAATITDGGGNTNPADNQPAYILSNGAITVRVQEDYNWGIYSLVDEEANRDIIADTFVANTPIFYIDGGGIYRFGNEYNNGTAFDIDSAGTVTAVSAEVLENGPVRVWLRTTVSFTSSRGSTPISGTYVRDYILVAGEPFLRMSFTGAAPLTPSGSPNSGNYQGNQYSVMVGFSLTAQNGTAAAPVDEVTYGTPYHWVRQVPDPYWPAPIFQAMHNVAVVKSLGRTLGAIYQSTIQAWGIAPDDSVQVGSGIDKSMKGAFIGCVLRNTPYDANGHGANGQDTGVHTHHYALRVPSGIEDMENGVQLQESLAFNTPLRSRYATVQTGTAGPFPAAFSLASASPSSAIITAAKPSTLDPSSLIVRLYQPTNGSLNVTVNLASQAIPQRATAQLVTALEDPIAGSGTLDITNSSVEFTAERAIATLEIKPPKL